MLNFKGFVSLEMSSPPDPLSLPQGKEENDVSLLASRKVQISSEDTIF